MTQTESPKVAVVILNWNGVKMLEKYLPTVIRHTPADKARVVVADNGSTDGSLEWLAANYPGVDTMAFPENYGFAEGYNKALSRISEPYTVLLNSDVEVKDDWVTPLLDYMEAHPDCGACQPKIRSLMEPEKFEYAGAAGGYIDRNGYPYCRGRIFGVTETDSGQYDSAGGACDIFWASGAALMVRTGLYNRVGGLDPKFFAHMEEIDLCWRIRQAGFTIACVTAAEVYHLGGGSLPVDHPRKTYLNFRNNLLMLHKNLPDNVRDRLIFRRMILDGVAWLKFVASFDFKNARVIPKAHADFRKMRGAYTVHPDHNILDDSPMTRINILVQHYLMRRLKFSALKFGK